MRIGMILDKSFPPDPRVENEAVSLIKSGFEVYLFCLTYQDEKNTDINGIQVKRYRSNLMEYKLSALAYTVPFYKVLMARKISRFLHENRIDIIHIHDIRIAGAVFKANKSKLPTVLDLHDNMPEVMKLYPHLQKFPGKYIISPKKWKRKEELFIKRATNVITVSQEFVNEVVERTKISSKKIVLVPNSVLPSFYQKAIYNTDIEQKYENKNVILYVGDTHIRRGLITAIKALETIKKTIPNVKLVVVGKSTTDYILRQQVSELNLQKYVDFEGWQNVTLFPSYIKASTVCISPLLRNPQHDVAYANKLFQYMSLGKPLLVSDAIAQKRLVESVGSGWVHKANDNKDLAQKAIQIIENVSLQKELGKKGELFIKNEFNWDITSKALIDMYKSFKK